MERYLGHNQDRGLPGLEGYPVMISDDITLRQQSPPSFKHSGGSRTMPRPKSLVFGHKDQERLRKFRSVVVLKSDSEQSDSTSRVNVPLRSSYQRKYDTQRSVSPTKTGSGAVRKRLSRSENYGATSSSGGFQTSKTSEYFSMSPASSDDENSAYYFS